MIARRPAELDDRDRLPLVLVDWEYHRRVPRGILRGLILSIVLWALLLVMVVMKLHGQQVEPTVVLRRDVTTTLVTNTSPEMLSVTVALYFPRYDAMTPDTTRPVAAIVSPRRFTLHPGGHQTVRLLVRGDVPKVARLLTCFTPTVRPVGRVALVSRLCLNALARGAGP